MTRIPLAANLPAGVLKRVPVRAEFTMR